MDPHEERLEEEVRLRREALMARGESLRRTVVETLDPRAIVSRNPVSGLMTSVGLGMFVGRMLVGGGRRGRGAEPEPAAAEASLASLALGMIPGLALKALPRLIEPVLSFLRREPDTRHSTKDEVTNGNGTPSSTSPPGKP